MARRLLSRAGFVVATLGAVTASCRHGEHTSAHASPAPSGSVAAASERVVAATRARHFDSEIQRARGLWQSKPKLDCTALRERADLELCATADRALAALTENAEATSDRALPPLETAALGLARLSQRVRYLTIAELSERRSLSADAGAPKALGAGSAAQAGSHSGLRSAHAGNEHTLELRDSPIATLMSNVVRRERDVVRALGAYLEYAPELSLRRRAFEAMKRLRLARPQWPLLDQKLREAELLESEPDLKRELGALNASGLPRENHPAQSAATR